MKAIPIASAKENPELLEKAFRDVAEALADGQLVCIFPEGQLSRDGQVGEFRPGMARILETTPVPVVPMALTGLWRSIFSRNPAKWRVATLFPRVRLSVGAPVSPSEAAPEAMRERVLALAGARLERERR
jgi:1-acyl-sn-glycerol-3-phosphate acyltransferase